MKENWNVEIGTGICPVCQAEFKIFLNVPTKKYCSKKCCKYVWHLNHKESENNKAKVWYNENQESELLKNKQYREENRELFNSYKDRDRFGGNRKAVLDRDGHKCVACDSTKRINIHHKSGCGYTDIPENNALTNLISLCTSCHHKLHHWQRKNKNVILDDKEIIKTLKDIIIVN